MTRPLQAFFHTSRGWTMMGFIITDVCVCVQVNLKHISVSLCATAPRWAITAHPQHTHTHTHRQRTVWKRISLSGRGGIHHFYGRIQVVKGGFLTNLSFTVWTDLFFCCLTSSYPPHISSVPHILTFICTSSTGSMQRSFYRFPAFPFQVCVFFSHRSVVYIFSLILPLFCCSSFSHLSHSQLYLNLSPQILPGGRSISSFRSFNKSVNVFLEYIKYS